MTIIIIVIKQYPFINDDYPSNSSSIHLTKHNVHRAYDRDQVSNHVIFGHFVDGSLVRCESNCKKFGCQKTSRVKIE